LGIRKIRIFLKAGIDRKLLICLVGQITQCLGPDALPARRFPLYSPVQDRGGATPGADNGENAMRHLLSAIIIAAGIIGLTHPSAAKLVKFEIVRVESPAFEGRSFGPVGTYDRIVARATIAVAPDDSHNTIIVDLDRAPRNAQGQVEAVTDVEILRPTNAANGNRRLLYEALNRGTKPGFALLNDLPVTVNDFVKSTDAGNGFLMNRGYTMVWSGWQGDIVPGGGHMTFSPPIAAGITGLAREDFIFDHTDALTTRP
jgi:hypothetical protein